MAEEAKKKRIPTPQKRVIQSKKRRLLNRSFKSRVCTAISEFKKAFAAGGQEKMQAILSLIYSLMDKGVKRGIYKEKKAMRVKSHFFSLYKQSL